MEEHQQDSPPQEQESSAQTNKMLDDAANGSGRESARKIDPPSRSASRSKSSLDFKVKSGTAGGIQGLSNEKPVTTKPGKRKKQPQQVIQQEQDQKQKQQQFSRPIIQSRARGSGGPPPHKYTLEDLDRMSEEQIYRLLSEDPELHAAAMKAAEKGHRGSRSGGNSRRRTTPAPAESKKSRRPPQKRIQEDQTEKEFPYFQWIVLLVLIGFGILQVYKSLARSGKKKSLATSNPGAKGKGGKQKKYKIKKSQKDSPKELLSDALAAGKPMKLAAATTSTNGDIVTTNPNAAHKSDSNKHLNKKTKKSKPLSSTTLAKRGISRLNDPEFENETVRAEVNDKDPTGAHSHDHEPMDPPNEFSSLGNEGSWQSVAKSKASGTIGSQAGTSSRGISDPETKERLEGKKEPVARHFEGGHESGTSTTNGQKSSTPKESKSERESGDDEKENKKETLPASQVTDRNTKKNKKKQKAVIPSFESPAAALTEDDEALALLLQNQEESIARVEMNSENIDDSAWEEVATKKKKGGIKG